MKILLVGLGGFGLNHLRAWHAMGLGQDLYVSDLNPDRHNETRVFNMPQERLTTDYRAFLDEVDIVDIVTPSTIHFELCSAALEAGKDVFVEKPMTMTSEEARKLSAQVQEMGRVLQVGYYYRFHPISVELKRAITNGELGDLRYLSGNFMGFKRARTDVGVTHTDGIHFIDLFDWLIGSPPREVYAVVRDHFKRGLEDSSIVILQYPGGVLAKVESGYIQPGAWRDKVVPNAFTSKETFICGTRATAEVDFETEYMQVHDVHQEYLNGTWTPVVKGSSTHNTGTATPVQMVAAELNDFLECVRTRRRPSADVVGSGVVLSRVMEAIYDSADRNIPVSLEWSAEEVDALASAPTGNGS
jgi:predicted dehydrogenase